jgi:ornithine decarboxylase
MAMSLLSRGTRLRVPAQWPAVIHPQVLNEITLPTPFLLCDLDTIRDRYRRFTAALPGVQCHYAMKCNSADEVLQTLAGVGSSFEIASLGELGYLQQNGISPEQVLYSNTVKPPRHVAAAYEAGVWRFAFDSEGELHKLSRHAPGSAVIVRLRVDDSASTFPLSRKFGTELDQAVDLMVLARQLGLRPYGVTFHVGSQCSTPLAWRQAIAASGRLMADLSRHGIELDMLNLGGGFPARYTDTVPTIDAIAEVILDSINDLLPYRPRTIVAEPGRYLVAESGVLVAGVLGREVRAGEHWLYLDTGAYHGLMETQQTVGQWTYPLWTSRPDHAESGQLPYTVTGPSCDSADTMFHAAILPNSLDVDDRLYIGSAGAYTLSYASHFNGFAPPVATYVGMR